MKKLNIKPVQPKTPQTAEKTSQPNQTTTESVKQASQTEQANQWTAETQNQKNQDNQNEESYTKPLDGEVLDAVPDWDNIGSSSNWSTEQPQDKPQDTSPELIDLTAFTAIWGIAWDASSGITGYKSIASDTDSLHERKMLEVIYRRIKENPALHWLLDPKMQVLTDITIVGAFFAMKVKAVRKEIKQKKQDKADVPVGTNMTQPKQKKADSADVPVGTDLTQPKQTIKDFDNATI